MSKTEAISTLLDELNKTVKEKGAPAVIALLANSRTTISNDQDIQFVVVSVCNQMGVRIDNLVNEQSSGDRNKYAKAFIIFYLRCEFDTEWTLIKSLLKHKDQKWMYELMKMVKTLKPNLSAHAEWHAHKVKLNSIIAEYKSKK